MKIKEHNNRKMANQFAEYITGEALRRYLADKVHQYAGDHPTVFDGAVGSGQLEQFVEPSRLRGVDIQAAACEACRENYPGAEVTSDSFFTVDVGDKFDCVIMNPPFSIKLKDLSDGEQDKIKRLFPWKKSGVVDDIFVLKSLQYSKRYGFYILFPGVTYRKSEEKFRTALGTWVAELNVIQNAFEDTQIPVVFLVVDKEKTDNKVKKEIYDCRAGKAIHKEVTEDADEAWAMPREPVKEEQIDIIETTTTVQDLTVRNLDTKLGEDFLVAKLSFEFDEDRAAFVRLLAYYKELVNIIYKYIEKIKQVTTDG